AALGVIYQVIWGTDRSNSQGIALTNAHLAALPIKKDLQMAHNTGIQIDSSVVLSTEDTVTLEWHDFTGEILGGEEGQTAHDCNYSLSDSGELKRTYDDTPSIIARHITYLCFTQQDDNFVNVVITATGPGVQQRIETIEFGVHMRSEGIP
ncbi:unnamed protein product, partial [marine sediment metagenome]